MKRNFKKVLSVLLLTTVLLTAFTGCQTNAKTETTETTAAATEASAAEATTEGATEAMLEPVNLIYYYVGSPQTDLQAVNDALNVKLKEKINATVELRLIDWGSYDSKMALVMASGEPYDLCFTSTWTNLYNQNVAKGAFYDMTGLLDEYAPQTKALVPQRFWDAATINGKIYGSINFQQAAAGFGFRVQKTLADKYNFDWASTKQLSDLTPFLELIKANEPDLIPFGFNKAMDPFTKGPIAWGFDAIGDIFSPGWVKLTDTGLTVVNQYDSQEFKDYAKLMRDWYLKGYIRQDAATLTDVSADQKTAKYAVEYEQIDIGTKDFDAAGLQYQGRMMAPCGVESYDQKFVEPILTTEKAAATMTAISATSENPERAMMFIELLNTDKEIYNLLTFGIEGTHYTKLSPEMVKIDTEKGYATYTGWEFGYMGQSYVSDGGWPTGADALREDGLSIANGLWYDLNKNVEGSPLLGFTFDNEPVKSEIANCQAVLTQMYASISSGSVDPDEYIPQLNEQLKAAGLEKILAEKQAQIDAWKAKNS